MNEPLSNVQLELLKLYSTNLSPNELEELREQLAHFYAQKSIRLANEIWDKKGYNNNDMNSILNDEGQ